MSGAWKSFEIFQSEMQKVLPRGCVFQQLQETVVWMTSLIVNLLREYWWVLTISAALLAAMWMLKKHFTREAAHYYALVMTSEDEDDAEDAVANLADKSNIAMMTTLWLVDMLSDAYVTYTYLTDGMYIFASLLIVIWLGSGTLGFIHRYVSWELCSFETDEQFFVLQLNDRGEPKPGFKSFMLYVLQVQPLLMAYEAWDDGMSESLKEEQMLTAVCEGAPSSLLQMYALLVETPKGNPWILAGSIGMSIHTVAKAVNQAFLHSKPEEKPQLRALPEVALTLFRCCDAFTRVNLWALLGFSLRPGDVGRHGLQQPWLPLLMAAEMFLMILIFKSSWFGFNLTWKRLWSKENFITLIASFLGTPWCCREKQLQKQVRFARWIVLFRTVGACVILSFAARMSSNCDVMMKTVVAIVLILTSFTFAITTITALMNDILLTCCHVALFPITTGLRDGEGGELELACRLGSISTIRQLIADADAESRMAAMCQAAQDGNVSVVQCLCDLGVSINAKWEGKTAMHFAATEGQVDCLAFAKKEALEMVDSDGRTAAHFAAEFGHLEVLHFLQSCGCQLDAADDDGYTPALYAAQQGHKEILEFYHKLRPLVPRHLELAIFGDQAETVEFLMNIVDVNGQGLGGEQALDFAEMFVRPDLAEKLQGAGAANAPRPQLIGLTLLKAEEVPTSGYFPLSCGIPEVAKSGGKWYYEIQFLSDFVDPRVGWRSADFVDGEVGGDEHSWAFDGHKRCWWHNGNEEKLPMRSWKSGDTLGLAVDFENGFMHLLTDDREKHGVLPETVDFDDGCMHLLREDGEEHRAPFEASGPL